MTPTQQQIIALAVEAGAETSRSIWPPTLQQSVDFRLWQLEKFYQEAYQRGVRDEREACAKLVESEACGGSAFNSAANYMAGRIRARSDK